MNLAVLLLSTTLMVTMVTPTLSTPEEEHMQEDLVELMRKCTLINRNLPGARMAGSRSDISSFGACLDLCRYELEGCRAVVYKPRTQKCVVKEQGYKPATSPDKLGRYPLAMEMCCLEGSC